MPSFWCSTPTDRGFSIELVLLTLSRFQRHDKRLFDNCVGFRIDSVPRRDKGGKRRSVCVRQGICVMSTESENKLRYYDDKNIPKGKIEDVA